MAIKKPDPFTSTEKLLESLCGSTFLKLWTYPNPTKDDGKEMCDLVAIFEDYVFLFFDRQSKHLEKTSKPILTRWKRWKKEVVDKQIKTAGGAEKYIRRGRTLYVDRSRECEIPILFDPKKVKIFKIVVAHGAEKACKDFSSDNLHGSLAISYSDEIDSDSETVPFFVHLKREDPVHILDSFNLQLILKELDTFADFIEYFEEKERAISQLSYLSYTGEEELLVQFLQGYNTKTKRHEICDPKKKYDYMMIDQGQWERFNGDPQIQLARQQNGKSYEFWDDLIQRSSDIALSGASSGDSPLQGKSAIYEMAKEPRYVRRALSAHFMNSIQNHPDSYDSYRNMSVAMSARENLLYIFLIITFPERLTHQQRKFHRESALEIACGSSKNSFEKVEKVVGICISSPYVHPNDGENFVLMEFDRWDAEKAERYRELNIDYEFFKKTDMNNLPKFNVCRFPKNISLNKIGRNDPCSCGSGKKFKKCCIKNRMIGKAQKHSVRQDKPAIGWR